MSDPNISATLALAASEEVLRAIYGDDLHGCPTRPESIAPIIERAITGHQETSRDLLKLYHQLVESLNQISRPPEGPVEIDPEQLRNLLSERLDGVHELTSRMLTATENLRNKGTE
jgi:hypothetical protein